MTRPEHSHYLDVWSYTAPRYRVRAVMLLTINLILFCGSCMFSYWMRRGIIFAPASEGYLSELLGTLGLPGHGGGVTLPYLLTEQISIQDVPMQIPIMGLQLASLVAIPILVSILYRFWCSIPFLLLVGLIAVMPWLAITLTFCCLITTAKPFRFRFRYMTALIALLPIVVYLPLAATGSHTNIIGAFDPVDQIKFITPWVFTIVAAALVFILVLFIAHLVQYRPGAITPAMIAMFALPVLMFEFNVGRDELYYRRLEKLFERSFSPQNTQIFPEEAASRWFLFGQPNQPMDTLKQLETSKWRLLLEGNLDAYEVDLLRRQQEIVRESRDFLFQFPDSRYVLNVLYIQATSLDMRIDELEFDRCGKRWVHYDEQFPASASLPLWRKVEKHASDSSLFYAALLRLAIFDAREGNIPSALNRLEVLRTGLSDPPGALAPLPMMMEGGAFDRAKPEASLLIHQDSIRIQAERLYTWLKHNEDPIHLAFPLHGNPQADQDQRLGLLHLLPRSRQYAANLQRLIEIYPNTPIQDNLLLELARMEPDGHASIQKLQDMLATHPRGDAAAEALFWLADLNRRLGNTKEETAVLDQLLRTWPDTLWSYMARRQTRIPHNLLARTPESPPASKQH